MSNHDALREAFNTFLLEQHERHKHQHNHFHVARNEWARRTQSTQYEALAASKPEAQAQAGEPEVTELDCGCLHCGMSFSKIAKKDAALKACVEAHAIFFNQYPHMQKGYMLDAITQAQEALK